MADDLDPAAVERAARAIVGAGMTGAGPTIAGPLASHLARAALAAAGEPCRDLDPAAVEALDESVTTPGLDPATRTRVFNAWAKSHPERDEYGAFQAGYRAALAAARSCTCQGPSPCSDGPDVDCPRHGDGLAAARDGEAVACGCETAQATGTCGRIEWLRDQDPAAVEMVREHYRVECALGDPKTRLYRSHVGILLAALAAAGEPRRDLNPAAVPWVQRLIDEAVVLGQVLATLGIEVREP